MDFNALLDRGPPRPWEEAENLPWDEAGFSRRMLREHLDQSHDLASRRTEVIERQVGWIHDTVLGGREARVLDLGCGPGFYTAGLARRGHACVGIDFGPAAITRARADAESADLACEYRLGDLRDGGFGTGFDLVMLLYGELNAFPPEVAAGILGEAAGALAPGGRLLLEPHTYDGVRSQAGPASWWVSGTGVFADEPHLVLAEAVWHSGAEATARRWTVIQAGGEVQVFASTLQAYLQDGYRSLLADAGLAGPVFHPGLGDHHQEGLQALVAAR